MTRIPLDPDGYSVNPSTGTIHTRYADHARDLPRTRTTKGVQTILDGKDGKACKTCYKTPRYPEPPRPPQRRRLSWAAPAELPDDA